MEKVEEEEEEEYKQTKKATKIRRNWRIEVKRGREKDVVREVGEARMKDNVGRWRKTTKRGIEEHRRTSSP